jgi:hypothetical protein
MQRETMMMSWYVMQRETMMTSCYVTGGVNDGATAVHPGF